MAWYYGTFACEHEGRVNIVGPTKDRQWKADRKFEGLCNDCWEKQIEEEREAANKEAAEKAKEMELPELQGSEKQVAWANTLRQNFIDKFENEFDEKWLRTYQSAYSELKDLTLDDIKNVADYIITTKTSATYYIDGRHSIINMLVNEVKNAIKSDEEIIEEKLLEEINIEATVRPEEPKTETVAEVRIESDTIEVKFPEMNEDFRLLMRDELKMSWSGSAWKRKLLKRNGFPSDRAAEAGHRILAAGFPIRIVDNEIRDKAIAGDYEEECTRWILTIVKGEHKGWLVIDWERPDDFYKAARKIPGSRYERPYVVVPPEQFEYVLDFAQTYNFQISDTATKVIDEAREIKERTLIAKVEQPKQKETTVADGSIPNLETPYEVDVDEELQDKD